MLRAETLIDGYNIIGCDALNVGTKDFGAGLDFLMRLKKSAKFPFVSANIVTRDTQELLFDPYVIVESGGFRFAIIGLTTALPGHVQDLELKDPVVEGKSLLTKLSRETDYQVVLFNGSWEEVSESKGPLADADFIFLSGDERTPTLSTGQPTIGPKVYRLGKQGQSLAIVRMDVANMADPLTDVTNLKRKLDFISAQLTRLRNRDPSAKLEEIFKDNPRALERIHKIQEEGTSIEKQLAQMENTVFFDFVPMSKTIGDDPTLLTMVSKTLSACSALEAKGSNEESVSGSNSTPSTQESRTGKSL